MTKKQAEAIFKAENMPNIPKNDKPLLRMEWNNYTDYLCKCGQITLKQYETWTQPRFISGRK
jgi:hypothetical protein